MGIEAPARVKYTLIREATEQDGNLLNISWMCQIAGVTRSGYYAWLDAAPARQSREEADQKDFENILEAYRFRGRPKGARGIHMRLLHTGTRMNLKKIHTEEWQRNSEPAMWLPTGCSGISSATAPEKCF